MYHFVGGYFIIGSMKELFALILLCICTTWEVYAHVGGSESAAGKVMPLSGAEVELLPSWIKQREVLNTGYLKSLDPERLLHNFSPWKVGKLLG